jgi:hypothetical protein
MVLFNKKRFRMKEGYEKYCRFYMCEEKECWYNGCQCEGERLIIPKETFDKDVKRSYSEEDMMDYSNYRLLIKKSLSPKEWFEQNKKK